MTGPTNVLAHIADIALTVLDAVPRRRIPRLLAVSVAVVAACWPELLMRVAAIRAEAITEAVTAVLTTSP